MSADDDDRERVALLDIKSTEDLTDYNDIVQSPQLGVQETSEVPDYLCETENTLSSSNVSDPQNVSELSDTSLQSNVNEVTSEIDNGNDSRNCLSIGIEEPVVNDGAGPSREMQPVVRPVEEVQQKVNLDLSSLKWQDALLVAAVKSGSYENVRRNLLAGGSTRSIDHATNLSCAQLATLTGQADILKELLYHCNIEEHNADPFEKDGDQKTLLHLAVEGKHYECLEVLVQKGRVSRVDGKRESPLFAAVKISWVDGVRLLLGAGADVKANYGEEPQMTVLHLAILLRDIDVFLAIMTEVTRLNDCETIINALTENETPLFIAVRSRWVEGVRVLLDAGADVRGSYGKMPKKTALHVAVFNKDYEIASAIVTHVCGLEDKDIILNLRFENESPLFRATELQWEKGVRLLLGAGADVQGENGNKTVLQLAVRKDNVEIFKEIVSRISCLEVDDLTRSQIIDAKVNKETPLMTAVRLGNLEFVNSLLNAGANVNMLSEDNQNLLHCAVSNGHSQIIERLFECKTKEMKLLVCEMCEGRFKGTPLHLAVKEGRIEIMHFLIRKWTRDDFGVGFDTITKETNLNLLHLASYSSNQQVRDYFITRLYDTTHKINPKLLPLLRQTTESGKTPLHYALEKSQKEYVTALIFTGSDLTAECKWHDSGSRTAIDILIHRLPGSVQLLTDVLDRSISKPKSKEFVNVDFKVLSPYANISEDPDHGFGVLNALRETGDLLGQRKVLEHPLVASYLYEHWKILQGPYMIFVVLNYVFAISLSICTLLKPLLMTHDLLWLFWVLIGSFVMLPMSLLIAHELQCLGNLNRLTYKFESGIKCICYLLTIVICFPDTPPEFSAFAVLLSNFELIVITSRIPGRGLYMLMFIEVTTRYARLLVSFILVIIGFAVAFMLIFRLHEPFATFPSSMMKTIVMMTNEFDYENMKDATLSSAQSFSILSQLSAMVIFVLFIILVSFVLTNLLVAVAVLKVNKLHRISKQVVFLCNYRRLFLHPPKWWKSRVGVMRFLYKVQQALSRIKTKQQHPADGAQARATPKDELEMCRTIYMNQKGGFTYKHKLNSELVIKGIMDRERLTKFYAELDAKKKLRKTVAKNKKLEN